MENRNYIINRIKAKTVTIEEFNYDLLQAPPISVMFTPMDIAQLNQIAKSIKYSAKPQIKYQEIDKIMRRRGFIKFAAGTNRVVYRPVENNTFIVKVAYDAIGLGDNPREFKNQFIFKPFVTKCFEITPCGTLGVFERANPITSREEFLSVASDIFEVINDWFIGEYVLEDIGSRYFMNYGIRSGFGPVLLDYPYCYKLDGNKLFCNSPDPNSPSGCCEGVIDYDPGYNFLYCTKCGVKYKAKELEEAIKEKEVIVKSEGDVKMKISIKGGSKNVNKSLNIGQYADLAKSMPSKPINNKKKEKEIKDVYPTMKICTNRKVNKVPEIKEEKVEIVTEPTPIPEVVVSDQRTNREIISPISFDEFLMNPVERFSKIINEILDLMKDANEDNYKEMYHLLNNNLEEKLNISLTERKNVNCNSKEPESNEIVLGRASEQINTVINRGVEDREIGKFIRKLGEESIKRILYSIFTFEGFCNIKLANNITFTSDEDENETKFMVVEFAPEFEFESGDILNLEKVFLGIPPEYIITTFIECGYNVFQKTKIYNDCKFVSAKVINVKDIFPSANSEKVIAIIDKDGNYLTMEDGNIVTIDMVDDRSVGSLSIVSSDWLNKTLDEKSKLEKIVDQEQDLEPNEDITDQEEIELADTAEEFIETSEIPTGIIPPTGVNGVISEVIEE